MVNLLQLDPNDAPQPSVVACLLDQLIEQYQHLGSRRITAEMDQAINDLTGSVSDEALPEMVMRLVIYRLDTAINEAK